MISQQSFKLESQAQCGGLGRLIQACAIPLTPSQTKTAFGWRVEEMSDEGTGGVSEDMRALDVS